MNCVSTMIMDSVGRVRPIAWSLLVCSIYLGREVAMVCKFGETTNPSFSLLGFVPSQEMRYIRLCGKDLSHPSSGIAATIASTVEEPCSIGKYVGSYFV